MEFTIIIDSQEQMLYCRRKADSRSDVPGEQDLAQEYVFERVDFEW